MGWLGSVPANWGSDIGDDYLHQGVQLAQGWATPSAMKVQCWVMPTQSISQLGKYWVADGVCGNNDVKLKTKFGWRWIWLSVLSVGLSIFFPEQALLVITGQAENEAVCRRFASSPLQSSRDGVSINIEGFRLPVPEGFRMAIWLVAENQVISDDRLHFIRGFSKTRHWSKNSMN